jgi:hypothetical protein
MALSKSNIFTFCLDAKSNKKIKAAEKQAKIYSIPLQRKILKPDQKFKSTNAGASLECVRTFSLLNAAFREFLNAAFLRP